MRHSGLKKAFVRLFCWSVLSLLCVWASGAESAKTIRKSYFFLVMDYHPLSTPQEEPSFSIFTVPAGVQVELLAYNPLVSEFVTVRLQDGSVGYMPVLSFADASINIEHTQRHIYLGGGKEDEVPEGDYSVVLSGVYKYVEERKSLHFIPNAWYAAPEKIIVKGKGGKTFNLTPDTYQASYKDESGYWRSVPLSKLFDFGAFDEVLKALPEKPAVKESVKLRYREGKSWLNSYAGCSKSYIESVFGQPHAYAGPGVSEISNLTYSVYDNILWKEDKRLMGKKYMEKGVVVWFDRDLVVKAIVRRPLGFASTRHKADAIPFYGPSFPLAEPGNELLDSLCSFSAGVHPVLPGTKAVEEKVTKPGWFDRIKIGTMYFFERTLGLRSPWAIAGLMLLIQVLIGLLIVVWIRYVFNYGSNRWATARCLLLPLPIALLNVVYLWRFPFLFFLIGAALVLFVYVLPYLLLEEAIDKRRCPKCHRYVHPKVWYREEGKFHGHDYTKTSRWERMDYYDGMTGDREAGTHYHYEEYKYETIMHVYQDVNLTVLCPKCNHRWEQRDIESRPSVRGPILVEIIDTSRTHSTTITTTTTTLKDEYGTVLGEKVEEERDTHTSSETDNSRSRYDVARYQPYYKKYINGDEDALDRYYEECWDDVTWEIVSR